uniref:Beta-lactamase-related domain-containing protein n=1 Tax=Bionectria ochroleuca TaxID=29856 RepID=A0A8H7N0I9_BIOOC
MLTELDALQKRLEALRPLIGRLRETTGAASVTFGVLHHGQVVFQGADGWRDAAKALPADVNTAYMIGSTMKAMMASCCGMLVEEGKLSWNDRLAQHVPFRSVSDPTVGERAAIHDALSHQTGLAQLDLSWYGASGKNLVDPADLFHVVANLPVAADFRSNWSYCNYMYIVVARIIEKVSGYPSWASFLAERLLKPLGMSRSRLWRDQLSDDNIAEPHFAKDDRTPGSLPRPDLSADTLMGPAGCLWSTVPDMLKWIEAVLRSLEPPGTGNATRGILKDMNTITAHHSQLTHRGLFENTYGYGWARLSMPSRLYGFFSTNGADEDAVPGRCSARRLMLYHGGQVTGYLTTLCIFPETESAIICLSNSQALGDASDWVARAIMQELFQLSPPLDLINLAELKAHETLAAYSNLMQEYRLHQDSEGSLENLDDKFGVYKNEGLKLQLTVRPTSQNRKLGEFLINDMTTQLHYLEYFAKDTFGFPPKSREEQESRCMVDYTHYQQLLLTFTRNGDGEVNGLEWLMQPGLAPICFVRWL